jgi:hypothetical protein
LRKAYKKKLLLILVELGLIFSMGFLPVYTGEQSSGLNGQRYRRKMVSVEKAFLTVSAFSWQPKPRHGERHFLSGAPKMTANSHFIREHQKKAGLENSGMMEVRHHFLPKKQGRKYNSDNMNGNSPYTAIEIDLYVSLPLRTLGCGRTI